MQCMKIVKMKEGRNVNVKFVSVDTRILFSIR